MNEYTNNTIEDLELYEACIFNNLTNFEKVNWSEILEELLDCREFYVDADNVHVNIIIDLLRNDLYEFDLDVPAEKLEENYELLDDVDSYECYRYVMLLVAIYAGVTAQNNACMVNVLRHLLESRANNIPHRAIFFFLNYYSDNEAINDYLHDNPVQGPFFTNHLDCHSRAALLSTFKNRGTDVISLAKLIRLDDYIENNIISLENFYDLKAFFVDVARNSECVFYVEDEFVATAKIINDSGFMTDFLLDMLDEILNYLIYDSLLKTDSLRVLDKLKKAGLDEHIKNAVSPFYAAMSRPYIPD